MPLPSSLVVAGHRLAVELVIDPDDGLDRHGKPGALGTSNVDRGRIRVRGSLDVSPSQQRDTLLHEVIHVVLSMAYLDEQADHFKTARAAERVVEVLGTHLLDTFRRNPALVAYLTEDLDA